MPLNAAKVTDAHFAIVNKMLEEIKDHPDRADIAYRMGMVSAICIERGFAPTRELFQRVIDCRNSEEVARVFVAIERERIFIKDRHSKRAGRTRVARRDDRGREMKAAPRKKSGK